MNCWTGFPADIWFCRRQTELLMAQLLVGRLRYDRRVTRKPN